MVAIRRMVLSVTVSVAVLAGAALLVMAWAWGPAIVHHAATLMDDPRPGERIAPTPEKMRRAQETWRKRRAESPTIPQTVNQASSPE